MAVALATYAIILLMTRENHLSNVLQPYSEGYGGDMAIEDENEGSYAKTAIIQRAVEVTEQFAESQGYLGRTEAALERASLPLRAGEALFFYVAVVIIATILGLALGGLFLALLFGGFAAMIPMAVVSYLGSRRRKKFMAQLPDTLQLLSGTLRAGYSLMQGVEAVSQEVDGARWATSSVGSSPSPASVVPSRRRSTGVGRAHGQRRLRLGRHGHPHPARGRRQPVRAAAHRGRHDDPARAPAARRRRRSPPRVA